MIDTSTIYSKKIHVLIGNGNIVINDNAEVNFSNWVTNEGWGLHLYSQILRHTHLQTVRQGNIR